MSQCVCGTVCVEVATPTRGLLGPYTVGEGEREVLVVTRSVEAQGRLGESGIVASGAEVAMGRGSCD